MTSEILSSTTRLTIPQYAMALAYVASLRSEDPFRKVGAVAIDFDNRVIGTAYNGLAPGYNADPDFWVDRDARRKYMLHAEVNLCSLFTRGNVKLVACTTKPCTSCMQMLCAYGVKEVYFRDDYPESEADAIAARYSIPLIQLIDYPHIISTSEASNRNS
ncbi:deoxycytidylate deaminase [Prosthecobacter sp.]|uniref:deoxycytidylate deaminase n=1 Tax=Prosthecobacter sp. TaxID=1965333 RepID=UPI002AB9D889|nr:deoxycytidylate deaminase [Prosthecobacter sp.]MDZ4404688.1 deoxycytidylate deaminase [Prosthecobacter sp.]